MDLNPLLRLKEALEGAQKNTHKILSKLDKFEKKLSDLDDTFRPTQDCTIRYTTAKENINLTLHEVEKTNEYFRVANEVKESIEQGYSNQPQRQREYLDALVKLSQAKLFLKHIEK